MLPTPADVLRRLGRIIGAIRGQAPGARMVGEFAVKHVADEVKRRVNPEPPSRP